MCSSDLMVILDIGVTVSTLPIAAFAAGIGVDYGIYIYSILEENVKVKRMTLYAAYVNTCVFRGCRSTSPRDVGPGFRRKPVQWRAGRMYFG